ncbi:MAG: hypothetical protein Q9219_000860 [cf. Caloplaca sp. 3 TL-2023]
MANLQRSLEQQYVCFKRAADDMKELAQQLGISKIILGGHDWGGAIVYRIALWYPELVTHIFTICTPYTPPSKTFPSLEGIVKSGKLPNLAYQLQLASGQLEDAVQSKQQIRQFLSSLYGAKTPSGELGFDVRHGAYLDKLPQLGQPAVMAKEMLDLYVDEYTKSGIHGTSSQNLTVSDEVTEAV